MLFVKPFGLVSKSNGNTNIFLIFQKIFLYFCKVVLFHKSIGIKRYNNSLRPVKETETPQCLVHSPFSGKTGSGPFLPQFYRSGCVKLQSAFLIFTAPLFNLQYGFAVLFLYVFRSSLRMIDKNYYLNTHFWQNARIKRIKGLQNIRFIQTGNYNNYSGVFTGFTGNQNRNFILFKISFCKH